MFNLYLICDANYKITTAKLMLERFLSYIRQEKLIKKNGPVLLAVSGGMDSMVLADLFFKAGLPYGVAALRKCDRTRNVSGVLPPPSNFGLER